MRNSFIERGGGWVVAQSLLMSAVVILAVAMPGDWTRLGLAVAGAALLVIGGIFGLAGVAALKTNRTPFPMPHHDSRLIQSGIYSRVRHPLYTSVIFVSIGWALIWQSWPALVVAFALVPFFHAKARREECWLREKFSDYAEYEKRVNRFVPGIY